MGEILECPQCTQLLRLPDETAGKWVQCPVCRCTFELPAIPVADAAHAAHPSTHPVRRPTRWQVCDDDDILGDPPVYRRRCELADHRGLLILTLGILSVIACCLGLILGPIAWEMGNTDRAAMRLGRMDPEGEGMTQAGRVCGIAGTLLGGVELAALLCWLVTAVAAAALAPVPRGLH